MHVLQVMLIEADTVIEAFQKVEERINFHSDSAWYDWTEAVVFELDDTNPSFAGRWAGNAFSLTENLQAARIEKDFLNYASDPVFADMVIQTLIEERIVSIKQAKIDFEDDLSALEYSPYQNHLSLPRYSMLRYAELVYDRWTPESGVFDLENHTSSLRQIAEVIGSRPQNLWLIPVDFHY
jgi:hypothetical protein